MKDWRFYDPETGLFADRTFIGRESAAERNTPAGLVAVEGRYDHLSQRVDLETGAVVDWQPPAPSEDHEWHADSRRWRKRADVVEREANAKATQSRIAELERMQLRALREAVLGDEMAKARLQAIDDEITALRPELTR